MSVIQYNPNVPYEVITIDGLYTHDEVAMFRSFIEDADNHNRTFTSSPFKNGKVIKPEWSKLMYERISPHLPSEYIDRNGKRWTFMETPKYIMYANINSGERFGIHTDTGCEYDEQKNKYSKFTVLTYLNDEYEGGNTQFYDERFAKTVTIKPRTNRTLIFDIDLFHSGEPVLSGSKYWIGTELVCYGYGV